MIGRQDKITSMGWPWTP